MTESLVAKIPDFMIPKDENRVFLEDIRQNQRRKSSVTAAALLGGSGGAVIPVGGGGRMMEDMEESSRSSKNEDMEELEELRRAEVLASPPSAIRSIASEREATNKSIKE
jgi:hypothetical protein